MTLKINGATGGSVSIDAPDNTSPAGTDVTLTLPTSAGSSGQYLQTNGSGTLSWQTPTAGLTWNTLANDVSVGTSGAKTISGIDSNAKKIIMTYKNVSLSTDDALYHMVGVGALNGTYAATAGYFGTSNLSGGEYRTDYFKIVLNGASQSFHGMIEYTYHGDNEWYSVSYQNYSQGYIGVSCGKVDLSGTLDRIALGGLGSSVFDSGTLSVFELV